MTQTFTPPQHDAALLTENEISDEMLLVAEPSDACIQTILNFSKNLDVFESRILPGIEYIKS